MSVLSIERYIAIIYPLQHHIYFNIHRLIASVIFCWAVPLPSAVQILFGDAYLGCQDKFIHLERYLRYMLFSTMGLIIFRNIGYSL